jgi:O-antigen/teichoic acid export membrane protein
MLQMNAIAAYFDFGLQTILGRFVAQAAERGEDGTLSKLAGTSMMLLAVASLLPLAACALFLPLLPLLFHSSSIVILHEIQKGVAILVIGTALSLPLSACTGVLVGLHRNEIPALAIGVSRLLGALTVFSVPSAFRHQVLLRGLRIDVIFEWFWNGFINRRNALDGQS